MVGRWVWGLYQQSQVQGQVGVQSTHLFVFFGGDFKCDVRSLDCLSAFTRHSLWFPCRSLILQWFDRFVGGLAFF